MIVPPTPREISDHLIGHFVDQARRSGASTEIGKCMGVTKQAAQKRFVPKVPDFRPVGARPQRRARAVSRPRPQRRGGRAEHRPRRRQQRDHTRTPAAGAALSEPDGLAAKLLAAQGIDAETVRKAVTLPRPQAKYPPHPFNSGAKKALELTFRQALRLGHNYIGTEHILLALFEAEPSDGPLRRLGADRDRFEDDLAKALEPFMKKTGNE